MQSKNFETIKVLMKERTAIEQQLLSFLELERIQKNDHSEVRMIFQAQNTDLDFHAMPQPFVNLFSEDSPLITLFIDNYIGILKNRLNEYDKLLKPL